MGSKTNIAIARALAVTSLITGAILSGCGPRKPIVVATSAPVATALPSWPDVVGCWELRMGAWRPTLALGNDERIVTPPSRVLIDSTVGTRPYERRNLLVRPAPGATPSVHRYSWWNMGQGDSIQLRWTTGFSGVNMSLSHEGDTLRGQAETTWDFDRQVQTADVVMWRVRCDADAPTLAGDSLRRNVPFNPSMHVAERGSLRHYVAGRGVAREWWELVRAQDTLSIIARVESAGAATPHVLTLRMDTTYRPRHLSVDGDEDATVSVLGARTRVGTGSTARTIKTPTGYFLLNESPSVAPWSALLRRWDRLERPARIKVPGYSDLEMSVLGRDSVLIGTRRIILERIDASGNSWGRRTLWVDTVGVLVGSLGGMTGAFALREGFEEAIPYLLGSARRDALRLVRNAADDIKPTHSERFAIVGATVLDGERDAPLRNAVVLVEDGRIARIGPRAQVKIPKGTPVVKGRGVTVMPGVRATGWSVSDLGWGPGLLAHGVVAMQLAVHDTAALREIRSGLDRDGGLTPHVLEASDTSTARVLREGDRGDFVVVEGTLRKIPEWPARVRWVAIGGKLYSARALRQ
ncbi:MAG TPA: hypothetical protein VFB46_03530 [Gemmatimonadaceae bacterium]|nr:hypothetical protein [Gemmatimonadaceae bacterium]